MEKLTGVAFNGGGGGGVSQIIAGTNVTISPTGGTGAVTINATGGGGTTIIEVTKAELDTLITGNDLVPGQFYLVTGVDYNLYGGTDIILQAATTNQLADQGHGIFYNPKYNQEAIDFGIYSNYVVGDGYIFNGLFQNGQSVDNSSPGYQTVYLNGTVTDLLQLTGLANDSTTYSFYISIDGVYGFSIICLGSEAQTYYQLANIIQAQTNSPSLVSCYIQNGDFTISSKTTGSSSSISISSDDLFVHLSNFGGFESPTAGITATATGQILGVAADGQRIYITNSTGDWSGSYYIYNTTNGATGQIYISSMPYYGGGATVIWGGKAWYHNSNDIGVALDQFNLDGNWDPIPYTDLDYYNISVDEIVYNYEKDTIISRKDIFGNEVSCTWDTAINNIGDNPIKAFQWGNGYDDSTFNRGVSENKIINSLLQCINFTGIKIKDNTLTNNSLVINLVFEENSIILCNTVDRGYINDLVFINSTLENNEVKFGCSLTGIYINNGTFTGNILNSTSTINNIKLSNSSILYNSLFSSYIQYNTLINNSYISNNTLNQEGYIEQNYLNYSNISYNNLNTGSIIYNTIMNSSYINSTNLTNGNIQHLYLDGNSLVYNITLFSGNIADMFFYNSSSIINCTFNSSLIAFSGTSLNTPLNNKSINTITSTNVSTYGLDITNATYIFQSDIAKNMFLNAGGIGRLSFYDALDTLQVVNINA